MCAHAPAFSLFSCLYCCKRSFVDSPLLTFITVHKFNIANMHTHRDPGVSCAPLLCSFTANIFQFYASRDFMCIARKCCVPPPPLQFEIVRSALIKSVDTTLNVQKSICFWLLCAPSNARYSCNEQSQSNESYARLISPRHPHSAPFALGRAWLLATTLRFRATYPPYTGCRVQMNSKWFSLK